MFKYLILTVAMFSCVSFAEPTEQKKTVICDSSKNILPHLESKYNEYPMFIGDIPLKESKTAYIGVTVNSETQTWTVILFDKDVACIIETGTGFKFKMPGTISSTKDFI